MTTHFSLNELHDLCQELGVEFEELAGSTRTEKTRELIALQNRQGRVDLLLEKGQLLKPTLDWPAIFIPAAEGQSSRLWQPNGVIHNIPHQRNRHFTGREAWLTRLRETLNVEQTTVVTQAIAGLGGVGKTQLTLEYCHRHVADYDLIWWLVADNEVTLAEAVTELGQALGLPLAQLTDPDARLVAVKQALTARTKPWLLVLDNADNIAPSAVADLLPTTGPGRVLITSRNPNWDALAPVLRLDVFAPDEAVTFLLERSKQSDRAAAQTLAGTMGHFPLALEHAAAYVRQTGCTLAAYDQLFTSQRQAILSEAVQPIAYHATISTTWELAFDEVKATPGALALLNLCSFLAPKGIPLALITQAATDDGALADTPLQEVSANPLALNKAIAALRNYSLLGRSGDVLTMHRLVQMVARDRMGAERARAWVELAVDLLRKAYRYDPHDMRTWAACGDLLPHLTSATNLADQFGCETNNAAYLNNQVGFYVNSRGSFAAALPFYQRDLAISQKIHNPDHPRTATSLNNLGLLLQDMGDLPAARPYYERALAIWEKALGPDHPDTAIDLTIWLG